MSILSTFGKILGGPLLDKAIDLFKDHQSGKLTKSQLKFELETFAEKNEHEINLAQIDVNKEDAKSGNFFQSGWRPSIGWICSAAFGMNYLIIPFANVILALIGDPTVIPQTDVSVMMPVLLGMLGIGTMREIGKRNGTDTR